MVAPNIVSVSVTDCGELDVPGWGAHRPRHGRGGAGDAGGGRAWLRRGGRAAAADDHRKVPGWAGGGESPGGALAEEPDAIEEIYEPFLIQIGFLDRPPRGRVATQLA